MAYMLGAGVKTAKIRRLIIVQAKPAQRSPFSLHRFPRSPSRLGLVQRGRVGGLKLL